MLLTVLAAPSLSYSQTLHRIEGWVLDAVKQTPLPSANIRLAGTNRGTITNRDGAYLLRAPEGSNTLIFSHIGYISDTLRVDLRADLKYEAWLQPTLIELPTMTVSGGDLARAVIRRAIEAKEGLYKDLDSYKFEAFTRRSISREDSIAGITEGYSYGYWRKGESLREEVRQYRATQNLPDLSGIQGVLAIVDFSRDDVELAGNRYVGPLHPNAFRWYDYRLEEITLQDGLEIYRILMEPRSKMVPLLRGTVDIADSTYALVGIDLVPAEPIVFPFVDQLTIHWAQRFLKQEQGYWLPGDIRTDGEVKVGIGPIQIPRIGFSQTSVIYDYNINVAIPDSIFERSGPIVELPEASEEDSTFWIEHEVLPLTVEEEFAYSSLDSTETLDKLFAPPGFSLEAEADALTLSGSVGGNIFGGILDGLDGHYNRVEGSYMGFGVSQDSIAGVFELEGHAGYGFSSGRWSWKTALSVPFGHTPPGMNQFGSRSSGVSVILFDRVVPSPSAGFYPGFLNSLLTMLSKDDYFDYHASRGWRIDMSLPVSSLIGLDVHYAVETHRSVSVTTNWSLLNKNEIFRPNPPVSLEGAEWNRFGGKLTVGIPEGVAGLIAGRGMSLGAERGSTEWNGEERSYIRVDGVLSFTMPTFTSRFLFHPQLSLRMAGGWSSRELPRELWRAPENALGIYGPVGALRGARHRELAGQRYAVITAEHNFRSMPFILLGMRGISRKGIELIVHGGLARSWREGIGIPERISYAEAGFGIGRLADILRLDVTRRLTGPAGWYITLSLTTFL